MPIVWSIPNNLVLLSSKLDLRFWILSILILKPNDQFIFLKELNSFLQYLHYRLTMPSVTPNFFRPNRLTKIVRELTMEEFHRGKKLTTAIQIGYEAAYYEVQIVLGVSILGSVISVLIRALMNSKSATLNFLW